MTVFRSVSEVPASFGPSAVTIGNFDGLHEGHRWIMRRLAAIARARSLTPTVLTFDPHPARILAPERAPRLLMTMPQRLRAFASEGIEAVLVLPFSLEFAKQTAEEFAERILRDLLRTRFILVGADFRYGYRQAGNVETLRESGRQLGFEVEPVTEVERAGTRISSTQIRSLVVGGSVSRACRSLGAPFSLEGDVVKGEGIGSRRAVPTLNLAPENEILPKTGVYVTRTRDLESPRNWPSVTNVGYRPTFGGRSLTVETFLLDALSPPAPSRIEVGFLAFVRDEKRFDSPEELRKQILLDAGVAVRLHRRLRRLLVP